MKNSSADVNITKEEILKGLENREFRFFYQPMVTFATGEVSGAEALIRWIRPDGTIIPPDRFIPLAEEEGIITRITRAMIPVLEEDLGKILGQKQSLQISLNLSGKDIEQGEFCDYFVNEIREKALPAENLTVEITERTILNLDKTTRNFLVSLVSRGVRVAVDDFGIGFSSFDNLSILPLASLKIDQNIIRKAAFWAKALTILDHLVNLAHQLYLTSVAEGVENESMYRYLCQLGCDQMQGYLISPALPRDEFLRFIREETRVIGTNPLGGIYNAIVDHANLVRRIVSLLNYPNTLPDMSDLDHTRCGLGRWLHLADQVLNGNSQFEFLKVVHREFHEQAKFLVLAAHENKDRESLVQHASEMLKVSARVYDLLTSLFEEFVLKDLI